MESDYDTVTAVLNAVYAHGQRIEGRPSSERRGRAIHRAMGDFAKGAAPSISAYPIGQRNYVEGLHKWWDWRQPNVRGIEVPVTSHRLRVSGRIDLVIQCSRECACEGAGSEIIDAKTGLVTEASHVQAGSAYPSLWADALPGALCASSILELRDDRSYSYYPAIAESGDFEAALAWYHVLGRITTVLSVPS